MDKNWIVVGGALLDGVGFEFFGPYTEAGALLVRAHMLEAHLRDDGYSCIAVELLSPNLPDRINQRTKQHG